MNLEVIKSVATKSFGRSGVVLQKHAPVILSTAGVVGVVASTILAARATLKLEEIVDESHTQIAKSNERHEKGLSDDKAHQAELGVLYFRTAFRVSKLYAPSVTLGVASIGCLLGAQGILQKRNVALAAAYKSLEQGFSTYRKRVIEEVGEEREGELYRERLLVEKEVVNTETGEITTEKVLGDHSQYARYFDEYSPQWQRSSEFNMIFLKNMQYWANDKLKAQGHVFLNEVYDMLGLQRSSAGAVVGWVMGNGDNFIDFGIFAGTERSRAFVNGDEYSILLDFNVDGTIFDKI